SRSASRILHDLVFGDAFGPYYYVFAIVTMTLLAPLFARVRRRRLLVAWVVLVVVYVLAVALVTLSPEMQFTSDFFWVPREPAYNATYFLAGWLAALYREPL